MIKASKASPHRLLACAALAFCMGTTALHVRAAPVTTHPRLWITTADIPRLQSWAVSTNPMYVNGLQAAAVAGQALADASWNWTTGQPDATWNDTGSSNWEGEATEAFAEMFAFMSLVDPNAANRAQWQMRAHAMLMWCINQAAVNGPGQPFGDPAFATYNRASWWGEAWGLTVDWIYPSLSAADKATIRTVFLKWGNALLTASTAGDEHPQPVGVLNDLQLLGSSASQSPLVQQEQQMQLRWAANNYFMAHMRNMALMSLSFDLADDDGGSPQIGSSLTSLVSDTIGAWLYQDYAVFETAPLVTANLGVPAGNHSIGIASGGLPVEGSLYGGSQSFLMQTLMALQTAGYGDTTAYGPQVGFINDPYWSQTITGFLNELTQNPAVPKSAKWMGPVYGMAEYGDVEQSFIDGDRIDLLGPMAMLDRVGNPARYAQDIWIATNMLQGGASFLYQRASNIWGNSATTEALMYFMDYDPSASPPPDPRPAISPQFIAPAIGRILARSGWTDNASWFTFRCGWETINHEGGDCGEFEFYRNGQWLTKEWSGYAIDYLAYTPLYHNTLGVQNNKPKGNIGGSGRKTVEYGGQWNNGGSNGDPGVSISVNSNYAFADADATNLYNHPEYWKPKQAAEDIVKAERSIVWLNPDHIVIYDRVDAKIAGLFRNFNLSLLTAPQIQGTTMQETVGDQQLTLQSLLPATASLAEQHFWKKNPAKEYHLVAALEPSTDRLVITDTASPASTRFLNVLQGTDAGTPADLATHIASSAGTAFDGAVVGNTDVMFTVQPGNFTSLTYSVNLAVTQHLITGLSPSTGYTVTTTPGDTSTTVVVTTGGTSVTDPAGVLAVGFPQSSLPTQAGIESSWLLNQPE